MIVEYSLMWSKPTSSASSSDNNRKFQVKLQKAYQVVTSPDATEYEVYNGTDLQGNQLPYLGDSFDDIYDFANADNISLERPSPILWIATVDYTGDVGPSDSENPTNPIFTPPRIDWDDVESEQEIDEDFDGNPIQTINGEPIEGVKALIPDQTVSIKRNMLLFNPYVQARYRRAVNSDNFLGWPPGTAKLMKLSASNVINDQGGYWEVSAQIQFRYPYRTTPEKAWYSRVRHEGYYERVELSGPGAGTKVVRAVDANKEPVTKPVLLNENGYRIPGVEPGEQQTAHWLEFKLYDSLPYSALGLL